MRLYSDITMTDGAGWNEHDGAGGKLDDKPKVEKNDVPTFNGVVGTQCTDGTQAIWNVGAINMFQSDNVWAAVECQSREDAVLEQLLQMAVLVVQCIKLVGIFTVHLGGVMGETGW